MRCCGLHLEPSGFPGITVYNSLWVQREPTLKNHQRQQLQIGDSPLWDFQPSRSLVLQQSILPVSLIGGITSQQPCFNLAIQSSIPKLCLQREYMHICRLGLVIRHLPCLLRAISCDQHLQTLPYSRQLMQNCIKLLYKKPSILRQVPFKKKNKKQRANEIKLGKKTFELSQKWPLLYKNCFLKFNRMTGIWNIKLLV